MNKHLPHIKFTKEHLYRLHTWLQWRSYYGLKYSTNLPIILNFNLLKDPSHVCYRRSEKWMIRRTRNLSKNQWRSYYGLKYSTNLPIILVFKVCIFCRQRNAFITSEIPMALVDIHDVAFVSLCFRKDTRMSK